MQYKYSSGVSLIEMMVAVAISVFLGAGVIQIFTSNKQTYRVQEAVSVIQENGRFAMNFLTDDIRMAGFLGCSGMTAGLTVTNNVDFTKRTHSGGVAGYSAEVETALDGFTGADGLHGYTYTTGTPATALTSIGLSNGTSEGDLVENTDILVIKRGGSCPGADVLAAPDSANEKIADNSICQIKKNDIVMISNCQTADIFGVSNTVTITAGAEATVTHGSNWNDGPQLANSYGPGAGMFKLQNSMFFIGVGSSGQPALFKRRLGTLATNNGSFVNDELVEGIEDMTILYGVDLDTPLDGVADSYLSAADVTNFDNVVSVRISLVARSIEDNITQEENNGDHRLRRTFTSTVAIRNRTSG